MFNVIIDLLRSDGSIVVNKSLVKKIGLVQAALYSELLSRYNYFYQRNQLDEEGYFFNTIEDLEEATGLSGHIQRKIIKELVEFGLITVKTKGLPAKRYFKIDSDPMILLSLLKESTQCKEAAKSINFSNERIKQLEVENFNTGDKSKSDLEPMISLGLEDNTQNDNVAKSINFSSAKFEELEVENFNGNNTNIIILNKTIGKNKNTEKISTEDFSCGLNNSNNKKTTRTNNTRKKIVYEAKLKEMQTIIEEYTADIDIKTKLNEYLGIRLKKGLEVIQFKIMLEDLRTFTDNNKSLALKKLNSAIAGGYMQIIGAWDKNQPKN